MIILLVKFVSKFAMVNIILDRGNLIALEDIRLFEKQHEISFPQDYCEFLLSKNGGYLESNQSLFSFMQWGDLCQSGVHAFLGITETEDISILGKMETYKLRMPSNLIPIAFDEGGNCICLSVSGEDYNKVYFWDHDLECEEDEIPDYRNLYIIANSFNEFLNQLTDVLLPEE